MQVKSVVAGIQLPAGKPSVIRGIGVVQHPVSGSGPVNITGCLVPKKLGIRERRPEYCRIRSSRFCTHIAFLSPVPDRVFKNAKRPLVLFGAGIGLAIRGGSVLDGTEVLAIYLGRKLGMTIGDLILIFNIIIFSCRLYCFSNCFFTKSGNTCNSSNSFNWISYRNFKIKFPEN